VNLTSSDYYTSTYVTFSGQETNGIAVSFDNSFLFAAATALNGLWKIPIQEIPPPSSTFIFLTNPSHAKGQLVDGALNASLWYRPGALTIDSADNLYVMDSWDSAVQLTSSISNMFFNYAVRKVSTQSNHVTTLAGKYCTYLRASTTDTDPSAVCYSDGNSTTAGLSKVKALSVSSFLAVGYMGDKLFFTDYGNNVIREVQCSKSVKLYFGSCVCVG
jgi:hypothetical protein